MITHNNDDNDDDDHNDKNTHINTHINANVCKIILIKITLIYTGMIMITEVMVMFINIIHYDKAYK